MGDARLPVGVRPARVTDIDTQIPVIGAACYVSEDTGMLAHDHGTVTGGGSCVDLRGLAANSHATASRGTVWH
jgi:hypothetical protein